MVRAPQRYLVALLLMVRDAPDAIFTAPCTEPPTQFTAAPLNSVRLPVNAAPVVRAPLTVMLPGKVPPSNVRFVMTPPWKVGPSVIVPPRSWRFWTTLVGKERLPPVISTVPAPVIDGGML